MAEFNIDELFHSTMKRNWNEVLKTYEKFPAAWTAKLTNSEDTALHIAVSNYHADLEDAAKHLDWVRKLVGAVGSEELESYNVDGNTPLHFAAAMGSVEICKCIASRAKKLMEARNKNNETPFFMAAKFGKNGAFRCLLEEWGEEEPEETLFKRKDGWNILHAAMNAECFEFAYQIIFLYNNLVDKKTEEGLSPLHILAMKPNVFESSSTLRRVDRMIYHCLIVRKLKRKDFVHKPSIKSRGRYPENYKTCMNLLEMSKSAFKIVTGSNGKQTKKDEESQGSSGNGDNKDDENQEEQGPFPPNWTTIIYLLKCAVHIVLILLGIGFSKIENIRAEKEKHTLAYQLMAKMIAHEKTYKYQDNGQTPPQDYHENSYAGFKPPVMPLEDDDPDRKESIKPPANEENAQVEEDRWEDRWALVPAKKKENYETVNKLNSMLPDPIQELATQQCFVLLKYQKRKSADTKKETPLLVAAKMGITEIVDNIFENFPVAILDTDEHQKNALMLAIENRQIKVFDCLMQKKLPEFVLYHVDDQGNSALHLAATLQLEQRPWRIPGAALQMQWELKWFKHVKNSLPAQLFAQFQKNNKGETPRQIFTATHEKLLKDGSEWLIKTSESCSVVAALIATVAFATSATVPRGVKDDTGYPHFNGWPAFDVFSIASLIALCFSVTSLVLFLAILTSRCQEEDFRDSLPRKLLFGLSSLFTSIAAILLSFCARHFFVLKDQLHNAAFFIYGVTCLPISFFAFVQLRLYFDLLCAVTMPVPLRCYKASNI